MLCTLVVGSSALWCATSGLVMDFDTDSRNDLALQAATPHTKWISQPFQLSCCAVTDSRSSGLETMRSAGEVCCS
ncbi:hypothetical protein B0H17DRAFT_1104779 [Mycena rosella]|uniref:Secreted protein n=1 Tax=Mycena rosella TaxID=1033263 RepID=A0AAD7C9J2_MYCRO|nr:hypothetical protein B0H17DRAFT_1104779 [Mycena rosella]